MSETNPRWLSYLNRRLVLSFDDCFRLRASGHRRSMNDRCGQKRTAGGIKSDTARVVAYSKPEQVDATAKR